MRKLLFLILFTCLLSNVNFLKAEQYRIGVGDILNINIIQPENIINTSIVSPSGNISVPYIGTVYVKGDTINQITKKIERKLGNGIFKYPSVTVSLMETRSRNFTISGEVVKPGIYSIENDTTVLKAISIAGGFTKFGSKSKVKILRPKKKKVGYTKIKVNIQAIIDGESEEDILIKNGDIIVVSESFF